MLPTLWFRNTWAWGDVHEERTQKPLLRLHPGGWIVAWHESLGEFRLAFESPERALFTENETNSKRLFNVPTAGSFFEDAFHDCVIHGRENAVNSQQTGTKAALQYVLDLGPQESQVISLRLFSPAEAPVQPANARNRRVLRPRAAGQPRWG